MKLLCYVHPSNWQLRLMALTTIDDRLLNTHWFVLISKIKIIDKWFNRSQETETLLNWSNGDLSRPTTPYHMNFHHSSLTIQVNQLKTNHPQPPNHSPRLTINQLITIQSHDNHVTTPERNSTQSAITHSPRSQITTNPLIPNQTNYRWPTRITHN